MINLDDKKLIPFTVNERLNIEAEQYKVVTKRGDGVTILSYNSGSHSWPVVGLICGTAFNFDEDGKISNKDSEMDLYLVENTERSKNSLIDELNHYFATTTKEQQKKDWEDIKKSLEEGFKTNVYDEPNNLTTFECAVKECFESIMSDSEFQWVYSQWNFLSRNLFIEDWNRVVRKFATRLSNVFNKELEKKYQNTVIEELRNNWFNKPELCNVEPSVFNLIEKTALHFWSMGYCDGRKEVTPEQ